MCAGFQEKLVSSHMGTSDDQARKAFASFQEKVRRTVFIDNLSHQATITTVNSAFSQYGKVLRVRFIPNYLEHQDIPRCALVEMENPDQARAAVEVVTNFPFMISGIPRPVRAQPAREEMFSERPRDPERRMVARWLDSSDPEFEVGQKLKRLAKIHALESAALLQYQLKEEEKLENKQKEMVKSTYDKYEMIENLFKGGSVQRLARHYNMRFTDDDEE
ncbi:hypothetical protein Taro_001509 [Colocasia esculenta]|uniref:RRM domain-containing protein n=1 Tax=Colocasia esculenta TaxID=4460 RepID=A0A843TI80_COLES|nr:hypothetical protein [Colocasia esculenta]